MRRRMRASWQAGIEMSLPFYECPFCRKRLVDCDGRCKPIRAFFLARQDSAGQISPQVQRMRKTEGSLVARFFSQALPEGSLTRRVRTRITRSVPRIQKTPSSGGRQTPPCWGAAASSNTKKTGGLS